MDWKKLARSALCLLVVCCILLNSVPVKSDATGLGVAATLVTLDAAKVITAILIGLGVCVGVSAIDFRYIVRQVQNHLIEQGYVDINGKLKVASLVDADYLFGVPEELVSIVRNYLFHDNILVADKSVITSGFSAVSIDAWNNLSVALNQLTYQHPSHVIECLYSLGVNQNVMILGCGTALNSYIAGVYFDSSGKFVSATFKNPLGVPNASLLGVVPLESLELIEAQPLTVSNNCVVYYSKYFAEQSSDYLTSSVAAFDFTGVPYYSDYLSYYRFFYKYTDDASWRPNLNSFPLNSWVLNPNVDYAYPSVVTWFDSSRVDITSTYDLSLNNVADLEKELSIAYPTWSEGVLSLPGSQVGSEEDRVNIFPIGIGNTLSATEALTQEQVWTGTNTSVNTNSNAGAIETVLTGSFLDRLKKFFQDLFLPSEDYLTDKFLSVLGEFTFARPIVDSVDYITDILDMPDTEPPVIYLHLEDSRGSYDFGGAVPFIDMRWYAEFKPLGDMFISSVLWVLFLWRLFVKLPGIVSGLPGHFSKGGDDAE